MACADDCSIELDLLHGRVDSVTVTFSWLVWPLSGEVDGCDEVEESGDTALAVNTIPPSSLSNADSDGLCDCDSGFTLSFKYIQN